jgi:hypothetical protein
LEKIVTEPETPPAAARRPAPASGPARRSCSAFFLLAAGTRFYHPATGRPPRRVHPRLPSYTLAKDGNWQYDPAYHGPFLYYANASSTRSSACPT